MNRLVECRLWDKELKEFVEDDFAITKDGEIMACAAGKEWVTVADNDRFIILRYTGLKDRNGVKIFEDYILQHPDGDKFLVIYKLNMAGFRAEYFDGAGASNISIQIGDKGLAVVVGNIYEQPELLHD